MSDLTPTEEQEIHDADIARQEGDAEDALLERQLRAREAREAIEEDDYNRRWRNR